jgi:hypothetical protein
LSYPATPSRVQLERPDFEVVKSMMIDEQQLCPTCTSGQGGPRHFRTFVNAVDGRLLSNNDCGSNGRRFDPVAFEFVGYSHCSCDTCF